MMSRKSLTLLAIALVVLGVLSWVTTKRRYATVEGGGFEQLMDKPIDGAAVHTIRAWLGSEPDSTVELDRAGDGWIVASSYGWPAKADLVNTLLDDLSNLKGELRSSSADVLADYQIDDDNGVHVIGQGTGGTELFHLVVGKTALRGGSFVRREGSNDVFLSGASLRSSFGVWGDEPKPPQPKRWLELRVHKAERQDIDRIVLHDGGEDIALEKGFETAPPAEDDSSGVSMPDRSQWTWKADKQGEFDKSKADGILGTLCNLYASDVVPPSEEDDPFGLKNPKRSLDITFQDGHTVHIAFGNNAEEDKKTYVVVGEDGLPALIYKSTVDRLFPSRSELKPQEK